MVCGGRAVFGRIRRRFLQIGRLGSPNYSFPPFVLLTHSNVQSKLSAAFDWAVFHSLDE